MTTMFIIIAVFANIERDAIQGAEVWSEPVSEQSCRTKLAEIKQAQNFLKGHEPVWVDCIPFVVTGY